MPVILLNVMASVSGFLVDTGGRQDFGWFRFVAAVPAARTSFLLFIIDFNLWDRRIVETTQRPLVRRITLGAGESPAIWTWPHSGRSLLSQLFQLLTILLVANGASV